MINESSLKPFKMLKIVLLHNNSLLLFHLLTNVDSRVAQSVMCLATDASLTHADPGVASSIPAWSHTFVEIDHEIISTVKCSPPFH